MAWCCNDSVMSQASEDPFCHLHIKCGNVQTLAEQNPAAIKLRS